MSLIVPTLCVGTPPWTLRVHCDAERHGMHSHAERGNDHRNLTSTPCPAPAGDSRHHPGTHSGGCG
ncbi:hypothetical protein F7R20_19765 [Pseudomonas brassicacearum subsp. brassicacearum]|nr:hypothetical protein F7R20_19765 [Pseudomonas brassicacearum subsp. brassicacearum]PJH88738.1 hypothetical protein CVG87_13795 [Pseudomonas sp. WCS365]QEO80280.1 hypothetical protein ELZ14_23070 [Pseudomonas brassicacearum]